MGRWWACYRWQVCEQMLRVLVMTMALVLRRGRDRLDTYDQGIDYARAAAEGRKGGEPAGACPASC